MDKGTVVGKGRSAEILSWEDGRVLKLYKEGRPVAMAEREALATEAAHQAGLPAPAVDGIVEVQGRQGIVLERIEGPTMSAAVQREPWKLNRLARVMAELQMRVHSCELPQLPSLRERLAERIQSVAALPAGTKEAVLAALDQLPDGNVVCHGDLFVDNIMLSPRGPIIIDWFSATRGNPLADVAGSWLLNRLTPLRLGLPERWVLDSMRALFHWAYMRRYLQLSGASRRQVKAWLLPVVAARLDGDIPGEMQPFTQLIETLLAQQTSR